MVAAALDERGHTVAVVDINPSAFRKLPESFSGQRIKGIGFDRAVLKKAGIEDAYGFAAVSSGDNTNIVAARVARENFGVRHVVARILDPRRAAVYERLGITTIGTATWSSSQIIEQILPDQPRSVFTDDASDALLIKVSPHESWIGTAVGALNERTGGSVAYIARQGGTVFDTRSSVIQPGDILTLALPREAARDARYMLSRPFVEED